MPAIITGQDVVDRLGRGDASDPGITSAIGQASAVVRALTEQTITQVSSDVVTLDGTGGDALLLPELPVTQIRSITVDDEDVDADDYSLSANGILFRTDDGVWTAGRQNIVVTYDHGWDTDEIPLELAGVALDLAVRIHTQGPAVEERLGQASVKYAGAASELTSTEKIILAKYRQTR